MAVLRALASCAQEQHCCACREEELLTAAWRESLECEGSDLDQAPLAAPVLPRSERRPRRDFMRAVFATRGPPLSAPESFLGLRLEPGQPLKEQRLLLKESLQSFTRSMVSGVCMRVLLDDGRTLFTETSLDSDLTHLVLNMTNMQRPVALRSIETVCTPKDMMEQDLQVSNQGFLDSRCTTLLLRDGQFISFVFDTVQTREFFEVCMKLLMIVKGFASQAMQSHAETSFVMSPKQALRGSAGVPAPPALSPPSLKPALKAVSRDSDQLAERCLTRQAKTAMDHLSPLRRPQLARSILDEPAGEGDPAVC